MSTAVPNKTCTAQDAARQDWQDRVVSTPSLHAVIQFHSRQKYLLMAHRYAGYRELGRYLADAHTRPLDEVMQHYIRRFICHLDCPATRKTHTNVLTHIAGYLKKELDSSGRQSLAQAIEQYRLGVLPLKVPLTLLRQQIARHGSDYIRSQTYLNPDLDALPECN